MPMINALLWSILILVALLSFQILADYRVTGTERSNTKRQAFHRQANEVRYITLPARTLDRADDNHKASFRQHEHDCFDQVRVKMEKKPARFFDVPSENSSRSLPAGPSVSYHIPGKDIRSREEAIAAGCNDCA